MNEASTLNAIRARLELPEPDECKRIRQAAKASTAELAALVGVTPQAIALWETGKRSPRAVNAVAYRDALRLLGASERTGAAP